MSQRFTNAEKIREIRRELALRKNLYPKWVAAGRMKADQLERLVAIMQEIHDDYMAKEEAP